MLLRGAHLVRRGRWLCELVLASLVWRPAGAHARRLLVLDAGRPLRAEWLPDGAALVSPPAPRREFESSRRGRGCGKTELLERQQQIDRSAHDRLRVLSSELRRIADDGERRLALCLGPRRLLDATRLGRRLALV
jgi:hypothetical protein